MTTRIDAEELAYSIYPEDPDAEVDITKSPRKGVVYFCGELVKVRLGVPDTFFTIPAVLDQDVYRVPPPKKPSKGFKLMFLVPKGTKGYVSCSDGDFFFDTILE